MIKILGRNATTLLTPEQRFEWIDLRGKELQLTETESDGIFSITLDAKPQGARKVLATLVVLATAAIAPAVAEQYAIDAKLQPAINGFVRDQITPRVSQVSRYIDAALEGTRVIDLTNMPPIDIKVIASVERDAEDNIVSTAIAAHIGDAVYTYSPVGVFDEQVEVPAETPAA